MKILYVAMRHDYGNPARGDSFEHWAFWDTLRSMGHTLVCFDQVASKRSIGRRSANSKLWNRAAESQADIMFSVLFTSELRQKVVRNISGQIGIPTVNWFTDDAWRFENYAKAWAPCFNWCITTSADAVPKYAASGYHYAIKSQWAHNPRTHRKLTIPKIHDVAFIGLPHSTRGGVIGKLAKDGIAVWCRGHGWPEGRLTQNGYAEGINASKINLNFSRGSTGAVKQIKARVFEVTGCGGFLLTEDVPGLEQYFDLEKEIATFTTHEEMRDKIRYYLAHEKEREKIACAGYERAQADHTYEQRFADIFKTMGMQ